MIYTERLTSDLASLSSSSPALKRQKVSESDGRNEGVYDSTDLEDSQAEPQGNQHQVCSRLASAVFSLEDPRFIINAIKLDHFLAEGAFSHVFAIHTINNTPSLNPLVIKISKAASHCITTLQNKYQILRHLALFPEISPFIFLCKKRVSVENGRVGLIFDQAKGNLWDVLELIREGQRGRYPLNELKSMTKRFLKALKFLHSQAIIHADFKPQNILVGRDDQLYVSDFGSCLVGPTKRTYLVTRYYRSPEVFLEGHIGSKIDMWSLACVIFEVFSLTFLFQIDEGLDYFKKFEARLGPLSEGYVTDSSQWQSYKLSCEPVKADCMMAECVERKWLDFHYGSDEECRAFIDLLNQLLAIEPSKRLSAAEALIHPILSSV